MADTNWGLPSGQSGHRPPCARPAAPGELRSFSAALSVATDTHAVALALDAARLSATAGAAEAAVGLCADLLRLLPSEGIVGVYWLGSPQALSAAEFVAAGSAAMTLAAGHVSLLRPVLRAFGARTSHLPEARLVVLGAGPIYDLPDLVGTPALERVVLCGYGAAALMPSGFSPEDVETIEASVAALLPRLSSASAQVRLTGPGFLPHRWDNDYYELSLEQGRVCLQTPAPLPAAALAVNLSFIAPPGGETLTAQLAYSDGALLRREVTGLPMAEPATWPDGLIYRDRLRGDELAAYGSIAEGMRFICPVCGATHAPRETVCRITSSSGAPVFACFEAMAGQIAVFRVAESGDVEVYSAPGPTLRVAHDAVVIAGPVPRLLRFDPEAEAWSCRGLLNYEEIGAVRIAVPERVGEAEGTDR